MSGGAVVLAATLLGVLPAVATPPGTGAGATLDEGSATPADHTVTPAVSPLVQSGPRNIIKRVQDTYVSNTDARDHSTGSVLHIGSPDNGTTRYRSLVQFDVARLKGATIKSAALRLHNSSTGSCAGWWMYAEPVAAAWNEKTVTWANRTAVVPGYQASANFGVGNTGCPDETRPFDPASSNGIKRIDVTATVRAWTKTTDALPNHGFQLSAGELDSKAYKRFCSMNPSASVYACDTAYNTPTLEVEFDATSPVVSAGNSKPVANGGYPADVPAIEFFRSGKVGDGPYQRWVPDAYHSVADPAGKLFPTRGWGGGTDHRLRPAGDYGQAAGDAVMVVADGNSGFVGVIPYPSLSGYKWAYNVGDADVSNVHGAELLPGGNVAVALSRTGTVAVYARSTGDPTSPAPGPAKPLSSKPLEAAHEVLYDPSSKSLWAVGGHALVRYPYDLATGTLGDAESFALPRQISQGKPAPAWGHDLEPVYGDPDRLWVAANAGIVQFSKSGRPGCYKGSERWPLADQMSGDMTSRWCTDYQAEKELNVQPLVKSVGNDPVSGQRLTTCADGCEGSNTTPSYTTSWLRFVTTGGDTKVTRWWDQSQHYRARWMVPGYQ
ncbi:DUF6528 family protein [Streptomyces sp. NPDC059070]|uniref:DUF6528 family protein n=1 Tax=Streptomyces sp. NPDC059070 TaxID=3346713 RepID=UPI003680C27D